MAELDATRWDAFLELFAAEGPEDDVSPNVVAALERFWRSLAQRYAKERDELRAALADGYFVEAELIAMLRAIEQQLHGPEGHDTKRRDLADKLSLVMARIGERKLST